MKKYLFSILLLIFAISLMFGASLTLKSPNTTVVNGQYFPIFIYFNSGSSNVVACDAVIQYDNNLFEVCGFDPVDSVFSNSSFSNPIYFNVDESNGRLEVICGIPTPGVVGDNLYMGAVIFRAKNFTSSPANFNLVFTSSGQSGESHVILDDGNGTDILDSVSGCSLGVEDGTPQITSFAQFADGIGYISTVTLVNPYRDKTLTGAILLKKSDGSEYDVDLNGVKCKGYVAFELPPLCGYSWSTDGLGDLTSGTVQVYSNYKVEGTVLFDSPYGTAGVGDSVLHSRFFAPVEKNEDENLNSGMAFVNSSDSDINGVDLYLLDSSGNVLSTSTINIPAHGQAIGYIDNFFPDFSQSPFEGMIYYDGETSIGGIVLRDGEESNGSFATMPVIENGNKDLYFAQFADGSGIYSVITLVNPSEQSSANVKVHLYGEDGSPLSVDLNGEVVNGEKDLTIPPKSMVKLKSDGVGDLTSGNVYVESNIPVGGTIMFSGSAGTAGVGASKPLKGFLAPVEYNRDGNVNTGLAIINLESSQITITLKLKSFGRDGTIVAEEEVEIPGGQNGNGEYVRFITDIFPDYFSGKNSFKGIVQLDVQDYNVAATVIRAGKDSYATLPVVEIK